MAEGLICKACKQSESEHVCSIWIVDLWFVVRLQGQYDCSSEDSKVLELWLQRSGCEPFQQLEQVDGVRLPVVDLGGNSSHSLYGIA